MICVSHYLRKLQLTDVPVKPEYPAADSTISLGFSASAFDGKIVTEGSARVLLSESSYPPFPSVGATTID